MKVAFLQKHSIEKLSYHYLAGALRYCKIRYQIFIENLENNFLDQIKVYRPEYIVYSLCIGEEIHAFRILSSVKKILPEVVTLVGGPFAMTFPEIYLKDEIDFLFQGDGEIVLPEFIKCHSARKNINHIEGVYHKSWKNISEKNKVLPLTDLQKIQMPDRDLYYKYSYLKNQPKKDFIASRGCPYKCTFCYNSTFSSFYKNRSYWRLRDIHSVIDEISYVDNKYGMKWVHFQDATFNVNKKWLKQFLIAYKNSNLKQFLCNLRPENVDEEIVSLLKEAGCNRITIGLQSGNQQIKKLAGRDTDELTILSAVNLFKKYRIRFGIDIIFGWPGETLSQAMDTIKFCRKIETNNIHSNVLIMWPGLPITQYAYENKYINKLPTIADAHMLHPNTSLLDSSQKNFLINMDKLFYYFIRFPKLEKLLLILLKLPPNRFFLLIKNLHLLLRSLKYDDSNSKFVLIAKYLLKNIKK